MLSLCASGAAPAAQTRGAAKEGASFVRNVPLPRFAQALAQAPETVRDDAVVIRLAETQVLVGPVPAVLVNRVIQVNAHSALSVIGQFGISYLPDHQKLLLHRVAIIRGKQVLDRTAVVNTRLLAREDGIGIGVYGGATTVQMLLDDVRVGDSLWFTYTIEGANPVFGKRWADEFSWDGTSPIELRRLAVFHPRNRPVTWKQLGDHRQEKIPATIEQFGDSERIQFEGRAIEAVEPEPSVPSAFLPMRQIQFSEYDSWQQVAGWADGLFPPAAASPKTSALVKQFQAEPTQLAQASAALHWVQNEIRYFSVSIGENSHRPQAPDAVLQHRYGDCKDKSYLLVSLLRQLGIQAAPMLVSAKAPALPERLLPSPAGFDHVIVRVDIDGQPYYVDPTRSGERGALSQLPTAVPGARALAADRLAQGLTALPEASGQFPLVEQVEKMMIASLDGDATLEAHTVYRGGHASWARVHYPLMSAKELRKSLLSKYEKLYPGVTMTGAPELKDSDADRYEVVAHYQLPKPVSYKDNWYAIDYESQIISGTLEIPANVVRSLPFSLPQGKFRGRYSLEIVWPAPVRKVDPDKITTVDNAFFRAQEAYAFHGQRLNYRLDYALKNADVAARDVPEFQIASKALNGLASGAFRIGDWSIARPDATSMALRDFDAHRAINQAVAFFAAMPARRKADIGIDEVCSMASFMRNYGDLIGAKADANQVWENVLDKFKERKGAQLCKAHETFLRGEFAASVPMFQAEGAIADADASRATLAWARFYAGDPGAAVQDMTAYVAGRQKIGELSSSDLANAFALFRRTATPIPAHLATLSRGVGAGWPKPVLEMQLGTLSESEMFAATKALGPDEQDLALTEAWFYAAQDRFAQRDAAGGLAALRWLRINGVRALPAYEQACAELRFIVEGDAEYADGIRAERKDDYATAMRKYESAAARGVPGAVEALASLYYYGNGVSRDYAKARTLYLRAAQLGNPVATNMVGIIYDYGEGVKVDAVTAADWFQKAADQGESAGASNIGEIYLSGKAGRKQDDALAFKYLRQAAQQGNTKSQAHLATLYLEGRGATESLAQAAYWAGLASDAGESRGQAVLGYLMVTGSGRDQALAEGLALLNGAAKKGNSTAKFYLGYLYGEGLGVKKDAALSVEWLRKAAAHGMGAAEERLGLAYRYGSGVKIDLAESRAYFEKAARRGWAVANLELGMMYETGVGVAVNLEKAAGHYRRAADGGSMKAQELLGSMLESGRGTAKDTADAVAWYRRASAQGSAVARQRLASLDAVPTNPATPSVTPTSGRDAETAAWKPSRPAAAEADAVRAPAGRAAPGQP
jgi:TPR repeat protein/transglutaminase-like putative cysteine protease